MARCMKHEESLDVVLGQESYVLILNYYVSILSVLSMLHVIFNHDMGLDYVIISYILIGIDEHWNQKI